MKTAMVFFFFVSFILTIYRAAHKFLHVKQMMNKDCPLQSVQFSISQISSDDTLHFLQVKTGWLQNIIREEK